MPSLDEQEVEVHQVHELRRCHAMLSCNLLELISLDCECHNGSDASTKQ